MRMAIALSVAFLLIAVLFYVVPHLTRGDRFFGARIDPAFRKSAEARRIQRKHRLALWATTFVAMAIGLLSHRFKVALIIFVIGFASAHVRAHGRVQARARTMIPAHAQPDRGPPLERTPGGLLALLLPFVLLSALCIWALSRPDRLPPRLPVHWDFAGPDRWLPMRPQAVLGLLLQHGLICLLLAGAAVSVFRWSQRVATAGPAAAAERQFRRRTAWMLLTLEYLTALPPAFSLLKAPLIAMQVWIVALPVTILAFVATLMHSAGQREARMNAAGPGATARKAQGRWYAGLFYFNRADPALFVAKRAGLGWTFNFGNPWAWVLVAAIVTLPPLLHRILR